MRTDEQLAEDEFRTSDQWEFDPVSNQKRVEMTRRYQDGGVVADGKQLRHSFSGHERNHLFLNRGGQRFDDVSLISGLDNIADSRALAYWDYDRDGWQDIALVNANYPLLNFYRNEIGDDPRIAVRNRMIAIRFVGGNQSAAVSTKFTARDGYGATVSVSLGETTLTREYRCGEGFAAQNSATMLIGIGDQSVADAVSVRWPGGTESKTRQVPAGALLTVFENQLDSPDGTSITMEPYRRTKDERPTNGAARQADQPRNASTHRLQIDSADAYLAAESSDVAHRMYTTMATWCQACKLNLPQLEHLRSAYGGQVEIFGIPVDALDTREDLVTYNRQYQPAYQLLLDITAEERLQVQAVLRKTLHSDALPSTVLTDSQGRVLQTFVGVPTASDLGKVISAPSRDE